MAIGQLALHIAAAAAAAAATTTTAISSVWSYLAMAVSENSVL